LYLREKIVGALRVVCLEFLDVLRSEACRPYRDMSRRGALRLAAALMLLLTVATTSRLARAIPPPPGPGNPGPTRHDLRGGAVAASLAPESHADGGDDHDHSDGSHHSGVGDVFDWARALRPSELPVGGDANAEPHLTSGTAAVQRILVDLAAPANRHRHAGGAAPPSRNAECEQRQRDDPAAALRALDGLPKVQHTHKSPRRKEYTPHDVVAAVLDDEDRPAVFLSPAEPVARRTVAWVMGKRVHNRFDVASVPMVSGTATHPSQGFVHYAPPLSFSDVTRYDMSVAFGLWHTKFVLAGHVTAKATYPQLSAPAPPMFYATFRNAHVVDGNVVTCRRAYTTGACMWGWRVHDHAKAPPRHRRVVALCDQWCTGYFHFTHEHLPRLALVHHLLLADPNGTKVTVPKNNPFVRAYLVDVLGVAPHQLLAGNAYAADTVVYPQPQRCGSIFTSTLLLLRRIVFGRLGLDTSTAARCRGPLPLVVLAERGKLHRMPRNYFAVMDEVRAAFRGRVEFAATGKLGVVEQIKLFNRAALVVGPHGANIANVMWMRHGAHLVEFMSYKYANMCYYGTAARLGVRFGAVFHGAGKAGHYNASAAEIGRHIEAMLDSGNC
jgi:hypothetical protein